jgi:hypothetical protein
LTARLDGRLPDRHALASRGRFNDLPVKTPLHAPDTGSNQIAISRRSAAKSKPKTAFRRPMPRCHMPCSKIAVQQGVFLSQKRNNELQFLSKKILLEMFGKASVATEAREFNGFHDTDGKQKEESLVRP